MAIAAGQYQERGEWHGHDGDDPFHAVVGASSADRARSRRAYGFDGPLLRSAGRERFGFVMPRGRQLAARTGRVPRAMPPKKSVLTGLPGDAGQFCPGRRTGRWSGRSRTAGMVPVVCGGQMDPSLVLRPDMTPRGCRQCAVSCPFDATAASAVASGVGIWYLAACDPLAPERSRA